MERCHVHIEMHGCSGTNQLYMDVWARYSGYLQWAATNDIIVLFPQAVIGLLDNPFACWAASPPYISLDETSYTNQGLQPQVLKTMIERLASDRDWTMNRYNSLDESNEPKYFDFWGNFGGWLWHLISMGWYLAIFSIPNAFVF